jgi:hypothetical protein
MFEKAARLKLRFETPQGAIAVEDLFDLPLQSANPNRANLDALAIGLAQQLRESEGVKSFVDPQGADTDLTLALDIVKYVIDIRIKERDAAAKAQENKIKKQNLLALIAKKEEDGLAVKTVDELRAMVETL